MKQYRLLELLLARSPRRLVRFPDLPLASAVAEFEQVKKALEALPDTSTIPAPEPPPPAATASGPGFEEGLAALATSVWRAQARMVDPATGEPREEYRRAHRHVAAALEAFAQLEVRLSDWRDQPFDAGLPVKVLSFQPTPGLPRDTIIEVVRPAVFWRDRLLQVGEVIVGTPATPENSAS